MKTVYLLVVLLPLIGAIAAGFFGRRLGRVNSHRIAIAGVALSCLLSFVVLFDALSGTVFNESVYTWATIGGLRFEVGFL
ncbi:MAG: NADH-quinone oxidoreductase subunit L, partial [Burkholderiaceae bacterium]